MYLHISWRQLAVPDKHDSDDVQGGFIQALTQHLHQLVCDLWTWTNGDKRALCHPHLFCQWIRNGTES